VPRESGPKSSSSLRNWKFGFTYSPAFIGFWHTNLTALSIGSILLLSDQTPRAHGPCVPSDFRLAIHAVPASAPSSLRFPDPGDLSLENGDWNPVQGPPPTAGNLKNRCVHNKPNFSHAPHMRFPRRGKGNPAQAPPQIDHTRTNPFVQNEPISSHAYRVPFFRLGSQWPHTLRAPHRERSL